MGERDLPAGTVLGGRYRIAERLGQGGMGTVYAGTQIQLGRRVAIKVLLPELTADVEAAARFEREAKAAAGLGHANIVQVTDYGASPGEPPFIVMELLSGRSLAGVIETEGRLAPARVAFIASQILAALEVAHASGIVHRDIKPDNVFLTSVAGVDDVVKVLDFGVAKLVGPVDAVAPTAVMMTVVGGLLGTPHYMAPEQARGLAVDARTDVYAVGACMYRALTGRLPVDAQSLNALLFAIAEQTPISVHTLRGEVDALLSAVVERALAKRPDDRFPNATEMRRALLPWSEHAASAREGSSAWVPAASSDAREDRRAAPAQVEGTLTPAPKASAQPPKSGARTILVGLAALAVLVVTAAVVFYVRPGRESGGYVALHSDRGRPTDPLPTGVAAMATGSSATPNAVGDGETAPPSLPATPGMEAATTVPVAPTVAPPAVAKPVAKATGGKTASLAGMSTNNLFEIAVVRAAVNARAGSINACYAAAEFDPIDHHFEDFTLTIGNDGKVVGVAPSGTGPFAAGLHACLKKVLATLDLPTPAGDKGGFITIGLSSRPKE